MVTLTISFRGHSRNQLQEFVENNFTDATARMEVYGVYVGDIYKSVIEKDPANDTYTLTTYRNGECAFTTCDCSFISMKNRAINTINVSEVHNIKIIITNNQQL